MFLILLGFCCNVIMIDYIQNDIYFGTAKNNSPIKWFLMS